MSATETTVVERKPRGQVAQPAKQRPRAEAFVMLRDFSCMIGTSFQQFRAGQKLNADTDTALIAELQAQHAPIQSEGDRTLDSCPRCGHVFACGLEK